MSWEATWLRCPGTVWRVGAELTELFDPESRTRMWIAGSIRSTSWSGSMIGRTTIRCISCSLSSRVRSRCGSIALMNMTGPGGEWKSTLRCAFPRRHYFAGTVDELVARKMMPAEMMQYFHAKLALCERCCFTRKESLSIIRGLPLELQANA